MPVVDLCVNTFTRTQDMVLEPGYFDMVAAEHRHDFEHRTLLLNNVTPNAVPRAQELVERGEITRWLYVENRLGPALRRTHLHRFDFGRHLHISDCVLAAICAEGPDWMMYVDAEARLRNPAHWIPKAIDYMERNPRIIAASPEWEHESGIGNTARIEAEYVEDGIAVGYGFSDQTFLARRADLAVPLAHRPLWLRAPGMLWHPSHSGYFLEAIIEGHMRITRRPKATVLGPTTVIAASTVYHPTGLRERLARKRNRVISGLVKARGWRAPRWREPIPPGVDPFQRFPP